MITEITGTGNARYKLVKSLLLKKNRVKNKMYTVEGIKSVHDAIFAKVPIEMIFMSEEYFKSSDIDFVSDYNCFKVPDSMFLSLCDTETPQGILAVIRIEKENEFKPDENRMYIYCDKVSDPGNLGTIIRTADAAGFGAVLLSEGCADLYSPKTVRSSMGSFFHIPVYENINKQQLEKVKENGFKFYCGALSDNTVDYSDADYTVPSIIAVGNEANGICDEILKIADLCVKIPIFGEAESLNVGIAAAVLMYEALRQRRKKM